MLQHLVYAGISQHLLYSHVYFDICPRMWGTGDDKWTLMGRALMGWAFMGRALWAGPSWAPLGRAVMGWAIMGPPGP